jgi:predicted small integral membrane protein
MSNQRPKVKPDEYGLQGRPFWQRGAALLACVVAAIVAVVATKEFLTPSENPTITFLACVTAGGVAGAAGSRLFLFLLPAPNPQ